MTKFLRFLPTRWWRPSAWKTWASYIHWRLETYGVFYPAGRLNWKALRLLLKQTPSYFRWLDTFENKRITRIATRG